MDHNQIMMNSSFYSRILGNPRFKDIRFIQYLYIFICILISCKVAFLESCDNYDCFKASWFHLIQNLDLYQPYPLEYHTEYNYSPLFALMMGAFAYLPNWLGIICWNMVHALSFLMAIKLLPLPEKDKKFLLWFCLIEFITAAENVQTNASVVACMLLMFIFQQKGKSGYASFFFVFGVLFKIYILTAGVFFLCYSRKIPFVLKSLGWILLLFFLPLCVISFDQLLILYQNWFARLQVQSLRQSLSLLGIFELFAIPGFKKEWLMLLGTICMLLVLLKKEAYSDLRFRMMYMGGILMFTVLFNPGVESPTYIIAVAGAALWYISSSRKAWQGWLMVFVFIFTCLSPTELFPRFIRNQYLVPYRIKAIPCIIVWLFCIIDLYRWGPLPKKAILQE